MKKKINGHTLKLWHKKSKKKVITINPANDNNDKQKKPYFKIESLESELARTWN